MGITVARCASVSRRILRMRTHARILGNVKGGGWLQANDFGGVRPVRKPALGQRMRDMFDRALLLVAFACTAAPLFGVAMFVLTN